MDKSFSFISSVARNELIDAACHKPKKLMRSLSTLRALASHLASPNAKALTAAQPDSIEIVLSTIIGNRTPAHLLREKDGEQLSYFAHLSRKLRITQGDLLKLHTLLAPEAVAGLRRHYVKIDGFDIATATFVPPSPQGMNSCFKDIVEFVNEPSGASLNLLHPIAAAAQTIIVHPFADGNGRMSRAMFFLMGCRLFGWPILLEIAERLWENGNEMMYAICNAVLDEGWSSPALARTINSLIQTA